MLQVAPLAPYHPATQRALDNQPALLIRRPRRPRRLNQPPSVKGKHAAL